MGLADKFHLIKQVAQKVQVHSTCVHVRGHTVRAGVFQQSQLFHLLKRKASNFTVLVRCTLAVLLL